ncbi:MAG: PIN domain-containing protein [Planctomycetia bacterium]|nr:PIN domain-containing protein [Planctomycetia bacterium]
MGAVVVDTNIVSYLFKRDTRVRGYRRHLLGNDLVLSFMTVAELDNWAARRRWGQTRREALDRHLQGYAVYYADRELCRTWATVNDRARRAGRPIAEADAWIAATALLLDVALVTHNAADFAMVEGLRVLSEPPSNSPSSAP